jgi:hypothetical protein
MKHYQIPLSIFFFFILTSTTTTLTTTTAKQITWDMGDYTFCDATHPYCTTEQLDRNKPVYLQCDESLSYNFVTANTPQDPLCRCRFTGLAYTTPDPYTNVQITGVATADQPRCSTSTYSCRKCLTSQEWRCTTGNILQYRFVSVASLPTVYPPTLPECSDTCTHQTPGDTQALYTWKAFPGSCIVATHSPVPGGPTSTRSPTTFKLGNRTVSPNTQTPIPTLDPNTEAQIRQQTLIAQAVGGTIGGLIAFIILVGAIALTILKQRKRAVVKKREEFNMINAPTTMAFLSHDWGEDVEHTNHHRVSDFNEKLQDLGLVTWFDEERLNGDVITQVIAGIEKTSIFVLFLTKRYMEKVADVSNKEDHCQIEFLYAEKRKGKDKIVIVIMEKEILDPLQWIGPIGNLYNTAANSLVVVPFTEDEKLGMTARQVKDIVVGKINEGLSSSSSSSSSTGTGGGGGGPTNHNGGSSVVNNNNQVANYPVINGIVIPETHSLPDSIGSSSVGSGSHYHHQQPTTTTIPIAEEIPNNGGIINGDSQV